MSTHTQANAKNHYIGLISGTSMDAVDAALVRVDQGQPQLVQAINHPYPATLRARVLEMLHQPESLAYGEIIQMELALADLFAEAVNALLESSDVSREQIHAIGSHGQTIGHRPDAQPPYTLQLGDNARLSVLTGINVVGDFRRADMAAGGQGAPLASLLHHTLFSAAQQTVGVLNIGGIGNLTVLPPQGTTAADNSAAVLGFDTGPGNALMDQWCLRHLAQAFDRNGNWAARGQVDPSLLATLLQDPYFKRPIPKSTGREAFNLQWVRQHYSQLDSLPPQNVQATLLELSAQTIADAIQQQQCDAVYVCGGGAYNSALMQRLSELVKPVTVTTTNDAGLAPEWVEATLFGWLAWRYLAGEASDLTGITGSDRPRVLGACWLA